jgi:hypothetical protein
MGHMGVGLAESAPDKRHRTEEDPMPARTLAAVAAALVLAGASAVLAQAPPQLRVIGEKVKFPENFANGVLYATVNRADNKQFRELFVSTPAAIEAARNDEPLPDGTVLALVQYRARLDEVGNPVKGPDGHFVKGELFAYTVMEKRAGWGADVPDEVRNGDWLYQAFTPDRTPNEKTNLIACFQCHKPLDKQDFVFSYDRLKTTGMK